MHEASIFLDESGSDGMRDRYYLLTLVAHDQESDIRPNIIMYEHSFQAKGLPDIPFHASPLLNRHGKYEVMDLAERKKLLSSFRVFFRHVPVCYHCIRLKTSEHASAKTLAAAMRKQIANYICTMKQTVLKYESKTSTAADEKFFGSWSQFKKGIFKEMEKKAL